jgi:hypothetical protein
LLARRPTNVVLVAMANKTARVVWAMLSRSETFRTEARTARQCPSVELVALTGRRSSDSIRARGKQYAASRGRIDDCKPKPPLTIKTTCNQGASIDDNADWFDLV